ncbi:hypothetical protein [Cupriavidus necator]|uniref:hypothetical protein n=1 Tax=Cupriavidus necator TaxID=106590 RepID=UPI001EE65665|nr:hypothetical protein [Cupriavidus necator]MDX6013308.1 hypothetical protein [Cupriavidus necator]
MMAKLCHFGGHVTSLHAMSDRIRDIAAYDAFGQPQWLVCEKRFAILEQRMISSHLNSIGASAALLAADAYRSPQWVIVFQALCSAISNVAAALRVQTVRL